MSSSSRMLRLLSLLQTHRYWTGEDLSTRLEVSPRTVRRDVDRLRELGYPVNASRGVSGGYQLQAGAALPPLLLDDDEAVAIAASLRTSAGAGSPGIEESTVRALSKIVQVMPPKLRRRVHALQDYTVPVMFPGPVVDAIALSTLAQGCRDDERLEFDYERRDGEAALRRVEPHRLVSLGRRWYLVAWDLDRHDWRTFRVDRLTNARATGAHFRQRDLPAADAAAFVKAGIAGVQRRIDVELLVFAPTPQIQEQAGRWATVEAVDDDTCRVTLQVDDLAWPTMLVASLRADFEVVAPPELAESLHEVGQRFTRCVG